MARRQSRGKTGRQSRGKVPAVPKSSRPATIFICGDLVWDTHIARLPFHPKGYYQPHSQSHLHSTPGGAWYLANVIEKAVTAARKEADQQVDEREKALLETQELTNPPSPTLVSNLCDAVRDAERWAEQFNAIYDPPSDVNAATFRGSPPGIAKAFSVWEWFEGAEMLARAKLTKQGFVEYTWSDGEPRPGTWRIKEFLGCEQPDWNNATRNPISHSTPPDIFVIDDLDLGFADHPEAWPRCLKQDAPTAPTEILAKATPPFDRKLWKQLLAPEWAHRLTLVVSAAALRDQGAHLSRGLSWDRTIDETKNAFAPGAIGWALRFCKRAIVSFGRSGAALFTRQARSPDEENSPPATLRFERFVFDPDHLEDTWGTDTPGTTFGTATAITAQLAVDTLMTPRRSTHISVSRGLFAARELHQIGGGHDETKLDPDTGERIMFSIAAQKPPESMFRSAFDRDLLDPPMLSPQSVSAEKNQQTLLTDALGLTTSFLTVTAEDIVRFGPARPLSGVPRVRYGKYFTVDREEIERLNAVRNLILDYVGSESESRPLSLAVFGPPGSGKSFAIKQLSEQLFGKSRAILEFNLSQFQDLDALHEAFHEVRDRSVKGQIPLVFWDEFDCAPGGRQLGWLKEFLAPMQDAEFVAKGKAHPFAKCIFIFAGGTKPTFEEFDEFAQREVSSDQKAPDFVSRLRGYVNVKGPNPTTDRGDEVHLIRRALLLRSLLEKHHRHILNPVTKEIEISPAVLNAFLRVGDGKVKDGYRHGARSMEAVVSLSRLRGCRHFGPSELPPREVVELHVTPDFIHKVQDTARYQLSPVDVERIAAILHRKWREAKERNGYTYGPIRDDHSTPKTHPMIKEYEELDDAEKDLNRLPARLTALRLEALGYQIVPESQASQPVSSVPFREREKLAKSEHRRWMREKLLTGYAYDAHTADGLRLHRNLCPWNRLTRPDKDLDQSAVDGIMEFLADKELTLVKRVTGGRVKTTRRQSKSKSKFSRSRSP